MRRSLKPVLSGLLSLGVTVTCVVAGELAIRSLDGYEPWRILLVDRDGSAGVSDTNRQKAEEYAARLPTAWGVDPSWFLEPAPIPKKKPRSEMLDRLARLATLGGKREFSSIKI